MSHRFHYGRASARGLARPCAMCGSLSMTGHCINCSATPDIEAEALAAFQRSHAPADESADLREPPRAFATSPSGALAPAGDLGDRVLAVLEARRSGRAPAPAATASDPADHSEDLGDAVVRRMAAARGKTFEDAPAASAGDDRFGALRRFDAIHRVLADTAADPDVHGASGRDGHLGTVRA